MLKRRSKSKLKTISLEQIVSCLSIRNVRKYNNYLIEHGYLQEESTERSDESGLPIVQKNFNLNTLNQSALWVKAVTETVQRHEDDIEELKEENADLRRRIEILEKQNSLQRNNISNIPTFNF